jgi:hypothetical protein
LHAGQKGGLLHVRVSEEAPSTRCPMGEQEQDYEELEEAKADLQLIDHFG